MELQYIQYLVKFLEELVDETKSNYVPENRDYIALLLNCYIKLGKIDKIQDLIKRQSSQTDSNKQMSIFEIEKIIE